MSDMWLSQDEDPRDYSPTRGEQANVLAYLRNYRLTFELKCQGLDAEQLAAPVGAAVDAVAARPGPPPRPVEHHWSVRVLQGKAARSPSSTRTSDRDADFNGAVADTAVVEEAWATWRRVGQEADAWYDQDTDWSRFIGNPADERAVRGPRHHGAPRRGVRPPRRPRRPAPRVHRRPHRASRPLAPPPRLYVP